MVLYPEIRSTTEVKLPVASTGTTFSASSEVMTTVDPAEALPETVTVLETVNSSSSGEVMVSWLLVSWLVGVGDGVREVEVGEGWGRFLRLLLAVQMPKVMTNPRANPMAIAKKTSFFI